MNKYRLPPEAYDRYNDKCVSAEYIKDVLSGTPYKETIDLEDDEFKEVVKNDKE